MLGTAIESEGLAYQEPRRIAASAGRTKELEHVRVIESSNLDSVQEPV